MNKQLIKQLFAELAKKITQAGQNGQDLTPPPGPITGSLLVRGNLVLHGEFADDYFEAVAEAAKLLDKDGPWSDKALDDLFASHLSKIVASADAEEISKEASLLFAELDQEITQYKRGIGVFGLSADFDDFDFGKIRIEKGTFTPEHNFGPFFQEGAEVITQFGRVQVEAIDNQTAELRATSVLRKHLAVLNALCSRKYPSTVILSDRFIGQYDIAYVQVPDGQDKWITFARSKRDRFPLTKLEMEKTLAARGGKRVDELLKSDNEFSNRVVAALELAGNAAYEEDAHTAFLLFAISLESAVLGRNTKEELTFQLAMRAAHLIGADLEGRRSVYEKVKELYSKRSKVVHTGSRDVTSRDVNEIRFICLSCLLALCTSTEMQNFTTNKELEEWFQSRMLKSADAADKKPSETANAQPEEGATDS